jgi:hypothetical protein
LTEQEEIDGECDERGRRLALIGWLAYIVVMGVMVGMFITLKGCQ